MFFSLSKSIETHSIVPFHPALLFAMFRSHSMHRFNHVFGNVITNIVVKPLSISLTQKFARHLLTYVKQVVFNLLEMNEQVLFVIEKIMVSLFVITILQQILFEEPVSTRTPYGLGYNQPSPTHHNPWAEFFYINGLGWA
jgi:hypothetical protein